MNHSRRGEVLTIADAAARLGVSVDTVRRRLRAGQYPHAFQPRHGTNEPWLIPVADIGTLPAEQAPSAQPSLDTQALDSTGVRAAPDVDELQSRRIEMLEREVSSLERQIATLERQIATQSAFIERQQALIDRFSDYTPRRHTA